MFKCSLKIIESQIKTKIKVMVKMVREMFPFDTIIVARIMQDS